MTCGEVQGRLPDRALPKFATSEDLAHPMQNRAGGETGSCLIRPAFVENRHREPWLESQSAFKPWISGGIVTLSRASDKDEVPSNEQNGGLSQSSGRGFPHAGRANADGEGASEVHDGCH